MFQYHPPAGIDDLSRRPTRRAFRDAWHAQISGAFKANIDSLINPVDRGRLIDVPIPDPLFFSEVDAAGTSEPIAVTWEAFPLGIGRKYATDPAGAWAAAESPATTDAYTPSGKAPVTTSYRRQDEYCEWFLYTDAAGRPTRLVLTAEGPEYWITLARHDFDRVVQLYRRHVSTSVRADDLRLRRAIDYNGEILEAGSYDPFNIWNTDRGVIHLTHPANTLGAEINLAARATALRKDARERRISDVRPLVSSSGFGSPNRSSDPTIGQAVNLTALGTAHGAKPTSLTLANPVGLYVNKLADGVITDRDGQPLDWFRFVRGAEGRGLMAVVEPPRGSRIGLHEIHVAGVPFTRGSQIAEHLQMVLYARTADLGRPMPPLAPPLYRACVSKGTDLTQLAKVNVELTGTVRSCEAHGQDERPPRALVDAYPDLFRVAIARRPPGISAVRARARLLTRDVGD